MAWRETGGKYAVPAIFFVLGALAVPLAILAIGRLGWLPVTSQTEPPSWEVGQAQAALQASLARKSRGLRNPIDPASERDLLAGLNLFRNDCAGCHGDSRLRSIWGSRNFYPRVPQFGRQAPPLDAPQIFIAVKHGIRYSGMGAWDGMLRDREIWQVATFLSRLNSLPPAVAARWKKAPNPS